MDLLFWATAVFWLGATALSLAALPALRFLPPRAPSSVPRAEPRVTVIVAARDEASRIERTVERLLAQQHIELQLVVADDRSTDATGAILRRLAARDSRIEVLRIDVLPEGWLGKAHACQLAAARARGDWLLFTDADAWMGPDVVARAVEVAERSRAAHVCLLPGEADPTFAARVVRACLLSTLLPSAAAVNLGLPRAFFGVGAFNLVRADAYREVGGYAALRLEVVDDVKLGLLLARGGHRTRVLDANRELEVHWAPTVRALLGVLEKNAFALSDFRLGLCALGTGAPALLWLAAMVGPLVGTPAGCFAGAALAAFALPSTSMARRNRLGWLPGLLSPLAPPVAIAAIVLSAARALRTGGIVWRDTFHPLSELRRGLVGWTRV